MHASSFFDLGECFLLNLRFNTDFTDGIRERRFGDRIGDRILL